MLQYQNLLNIALVFADYPLLKPSMVGLCEALKKIIYRYKHPLNFYSQPTWKSSIIMVTVLLEYIDLLVFVTIRV